MAKVPPNAVLLLRKRAFTVGVENVRVQAAATLGERNSGDSSIVDKELAEGEKKDVLWMRDPKTGNWIPESHFNDVDVAEVREKLLPKKPTSETVSGS